MIGRRALRDEAAAEGGFSLAEVMIGAALVLLLAGATLGFLDSAGRTIAVSSRETSSLDQARTTLGRIEHEVRIATHVADADSNCPVETCLIMTVPHPGGGLDDVRYRYVSSSKTLFRARGDATLGQWDPETPAATSVTNGTSAVFCRAAACTTPNEESIEIVLKLNVLPAHPEQTVVLQSYATPRNLG